MIEKAKQNSITENSKQPFLFEERYVQPKLIDSYSEEEQKDLVSNLKKSVKGKLMRSYALELERSYEEDGIYSHRRVVNTFLNLLIHNKEKVLIKSGERNGKDTYDDSGWTIDSYELNCNGDSEKQDFSINLKLDHPDLDEKTSVVNVPFLREDFDEIEFFDGVDERNRFYDETVYELTRIRDESLSN
jgi:hypothetical protein